MTIDDCRLLERADFAKVAQATTAESGNPDVSGKNSRKTRRHISIQPQGALLLSDRLMELATQAMHPPHHIYGIDFSGAQDAGRKIRIAEGVVKGDSLFIEDCSRARDLQDSGNDKDFIKENQDAALGLDFPFGLPEVLERDEK